MKAAGLRQAGLAKAIRISPGFLSQLLSGERSPSRHTLVDLATALRISVAWLRDGVGEMRPTPATPPAEPYGARGWIEALRPTLIGSPLEDALPSLTLDVDDTDRAWRELQEDRRKEVTATLRTMATVAIFIERTLPQSIAERLIDDLTRHVNEYLADAF